MLTWKASMRANRLSHTAVKIAKGMVYLGRDPETARFLPRGAAECSEKLLTHAGLMKSWEKSLYRAPWFRGFMGFMERRMMHGPLIFSLRKRFIEDETRDAISKGATQVLSVGAGLDTLCVRLSAEFPEVTFVEADHPATHAVKRPAVEAMGATRANLHMLGVDLASTTLRAALSPSGLWKTDARGVIVAEGVLMYLQEAAVSSLLEDARHSVGAGSRLLFTYLKKDAAGRIRVGRLGFLMRASLRVIGEALNWGVRDRDELRKLLELRGWRLDRDAERCDLGRRYLISPEPRISTREIEFMGMAEAID
ncbi:MAG: SAM-dependent methyltransferase [Elusimicrobiota bacterium]